MNSENKEIDINPESASIQTHLSIIQNVIQRMASNSSSCKTWCVTLVSAILVIIADKGNPSYAWITIIPILIFFSLDAYYLSLEKGFRNSYNKFIRKAHENSLTENDLYSVAPEGDMKDLMKKSITSFSVGGFYLPMVFLVYVTKSIAIT